MWQHNSWRWVCLQTWLHKSSWGEGGSPFPWKSLHSFGTFSCTSSPPPALPPPHAFPWNGPREGQGGNLASRLSVPSSALAFSLAVGEPGLPPGLPSQVSSASHLAQSSELAVWAPLRFQLFLGGGVENRAACVMSHFNRPHKSTCSESCCVHTACVPCTLPT